jgi:hypothetical protein
MSDQIRLRHTICNLLPAGIEGFDSLAAPAWFGLEVAE